MNVASLIPHRLAAGMLAVTLIGGIGASTAAAGPIIVTGTEVQTGTFYNANFMQGFDFTPTVASSLTALGFWDAGSDGLPGAFSVGLWNTTTQTLLASVSIDNADPIAGPVVAGGAWRYQSLGAPVALLSGQSYTLAWQTGPADLSALDSLILSYPTIVFDPSVAVTDNFRFLFTAGFTFPTNSGAAGTIFRAMANAEITAVPEPATLLLLGAGLGFVARRRRG